MKKLLLLFISILYLNANNEINQDFDDLSHEYTRCIAYFNIASSAVSNDKKLQKKVDFYKNISSDLAIKYAEKANRTTDMAEKVVLSRYELLVDEMIKEIDSHYANFSILTNKYQKKCIDYIQKSNSLYPDKQNIGFLKNQKYVCINQGMIIDKKLEKNMSEEEALKYPIRFYIDDKNILNTDAGLKLPIKNVEENYYSNGKTEVLLTIDSNKRVMLFTDEMLMNIPALYICQETDNWSLSK